MSCQYAAPKPDKCPACLSAAGLFRDDWQGRWCCDNCGWYDGIEADQLHKAMKDARNAFQALDRARACTEQHRIGPR